MIKKENYKINRILSEDNNNVTIIETYDLPRYSARVCNDCHYECEAVIEDIREYCKIWIPKRSDYSTLANVELDANEVFTGKCLSEDLVNYQKYLDDTFGKDEYEAFVLGAYIHSGTAFSVNKEGNHVCRFDSSQLGFIGLKKNTEDCYSAEHPDKVADDLTAAWEGEFNEYQVIDNLTNDVIDSIITADYDEAGKWCDKAKEKYNVNFDDVESIY